MDILTTIGENLLRLRPLAFIMPNEAGVLLRGGDFKRNLPTGWYFCWPVIDQVLEIDVTPQTVDIRNQKVTAADGKVYELSTAIEYQISDVKKVLLEVQNPDISLKTFAQLATDRYMRDQEGTVDRSDLETQVGKTIEDKAEKWGIEILDFGTNEFVPFEIAILVCGNKDEL